jgi:SAM-dependent methyltransferase
MHDQASAWGRSASAYEKQFIDPYRADVRNPVVSALRRMRGAASLTAGDLGCGTGPLLPLLAERFAKVHAVDFSADMLARARSRCQGLTNVSFHERAFSDLAPLHGQLDVAVSINSLVLPDLEQMEQALVQMRLCLKPGGRLYGIVPSIDSVFYETMLLVDRARKRGLPLEQARKNAANLAEHSSYDFAFARFFHHGIEQHFWQPYEIPYRLRRAGFRRWQLRKTRLAWAQFAGARDLAGLPPPWDWSFVAFP